MESGIALKAVFGAVASCALVHVGFGVFGMEPVLDAMGQAIGAAFGVSL